MAIYFFLSFCNILNFFPLSFYLRFAILWNFLPCYFLVLAKTLQFLTLFILFFLGILYLHQFFSNFAISCKFLPWFYIALQCFQDLCYILTQNFCDILKFSRVFILRNFAFVSFLLCNNLEFSPMLFLALLVIVFCCFEILQFYLLSLVFYCF